MDELLIIKRGYIYEFEPKTDCENKLFALAVSSDGRSADNVVSVIILSKIYSFGCVEIVNNQFPESVLYCNCGKVTHAERYRLKREISKVSDRKMEKIDRAIASALGINPMMMEAENKVYKELYQELLERVLGNGKTNTDEN